VAAVTAQLSDKHKKRATYLSLMGSFAGLFAATARQSGRGGRGLELSTLDIALLGIATYRAGRLIAFDQVTEPLRAPVTEETGGGVRSEGSGVQAAIGEMLSCPTCIGTWIAASLVLGLRVAPAPTRTFLAFMSASGLAELLDYATEALDSSQSAARARAAVDGQLAHAQSGS
jgi:hypothetical protein